MTTPDNLTTHRAAIRALAQYVVTNGHGTMAFDLLRTYALAAGVTQDGAGYVRFLPTGYRQRGWFNFARSMAETAEDLSPALTRVAVLNALAKAHARGEEATGLPSRFAMRLDVTSGTVIRGGDMTPRMATVNDLGELAKRLDDIASRLAATPSVPTEAIVVKDDADLPELRDALDDIRKRLEQRIVTDTGKAMLDVLDGWIEGAREIAEQTAADPEEFHASDIRRMVNDACRMMGAPEAYRA